MTNNTTPDTLHAHVSTEATDCDGRHFGGYTVFMSEEQSISAFGDIDFMNEVFVLAASVYAVKDGKVYITEDGFTYEERTEEGGRSSEVVWCRKDCPRD